MEAEPTISGDAELKQLEQEALDLIESGEQLTYLSRKINIFILFKKTEQDLMKFAYKCPECGKTEKGEKELSKPYILNCSSCNHGIFKQEKVPKKGVKKKK